LGIKRLSDTCRNDGHISCWKRTSCSATSKKTGSLLSKPTIPTANLGAILVKLPIAIPSTLPQLDSVRRYLLSAFQSGDPPTRGLSWTSKSRAVRPFRLPAFSHLSPRSTLSPRFRPVFFLNHKYPIRSPMPLMETFDRFSHLATELRLPVWEVALQSPAKLGSATVTSMIPQYVLYHLRAASRAS
jgi:hypothetical protein